MDENRESPANVPPGLVTAASYSWRILAVGALAFVCLSILGRLQVVVIALFIGLVVAAIVSPLVKLLGRYLPRVFAVTVGLVLLVFVIMGILAFITTSITTQWATLSDQFVDGVREIEIWLGDSPLHVQSADFVVWYGNARDWVVDHRGDIVAGAVGSAGTVLEAVAALALAVFSAVFFLSGGDKIWAWVLKIFSQPTRSRIDGAGHVAWRSFAGYTRGIIIVAAVNSLFVLFLLLILQVPLALPLALIVFFGTFIPLIGAPIAMLIAVIVALAARGPVVALIVLAGIFLLGQLEGHVLQPLVMSKAVNIHPLAVAVAVASGTILAGLFGAVIAVPVVSVCYGVAKFWYQTKPSPPPDSLSESPPGPGVLTAD